MFHDFSHWIDEDKARHDWVIQTLEQMDRWRQAGLRVHPALLFALIFGEYHEFLIQQLEESGQTPHDAARNAVQGHLRKICENVRVPKQAIYQVCDIMSNQRRFERTEGRRPARFMQSRSFLDAFLYFKFSSKTTGRHQDLLEFWTKLRKSNPPKAAPRKGRGSKKPKPDGKIPIK